MKISCYNLETSTDALRIKLNIKELQKWNKTDVETIKTAGILETFTVK